MKEWRAIATRYEKTAVSFMGVLCLAAAIDSLIFLSPLADIGRPTKASPTKLGSGSHRRRLVDAFVPQQRPDGPGHLGCQRHDGSVGVRPRQQAS